MTGGAQSCTGESCAAFEMVCRRRRWAAPAGTTAKLQGKRSPITLIGKGICWVPGPAPCWDGHSFRSPRSVGSNIELGKCLCKQHKPCTDRVFANSSRFEAAASLTRVLNNGITAPTGPALPVTPSRMEVRQINPHNRFLVSLDALSQTDGIQQHSCDA